MRTKVDYVAIPGIAQHHCDRGVIVVLAGLLLSACGSGNPDSLIGMNVDENLAMTDANEMSDGNLAASNASSATDTATDARFANQSAPAAKVGLPRGSGGNSAEVDADEAAATNPPTDDDQANHAGEEPNAT
jgi:hypothetical protein